VVVFAICRVTFSVRCGTVVQIDESNACMPPMDDKEELGDCVEV